MALIDYYQIQEDLKSIIQAGPSGGWTANGGEGPYEVYIEAMERDATLDHMPFINVKLIDGDIEVRSLPNGYYAKLQFEIDVATFDFTHFRDAATLRDDLMGEAQLAVQQTPRFNGDISTSTISPEIRFGAGTVEGAGGHVAMGTFIVIVEVYVDPA